MLLSIIVPTFNESENIEPMVQRIASALAGCSGPYEIWFIDDSNDDTPQVLDRVTQQHANVHYVHRTVERGLATAVTEGFRHAQGDFFVVMDADLQHPPEIIPAILEHLQQGIDVVIPSRFVRGGSDGGLNSVRKLVSFTARKLGQFAISRLRKVSDCTGGFFGLRRTVVENVPFHPIGWKILIEVLARGNYTRVHEIPYEFVARDAGYSKMSLREQWNYIRHLTLLIREIESERRFYIFCFVGALGVVVNLGVMSALVYLFHFQVAVASISASLIAMVHNFLWNDNVTWRGHQKQIKWQRFLQMPTFMAISTVGILITAGFAQTFRAFHWNELLGQFVGIAIATVWNFKANGKWTWSDKKNSASPGKIRVTREKQSRSTP